MGGLLYKDFVSIKGKRLVLVLLLLTVAFLVLRIVFPGNMDHSAFMALDDDGQEINMLDAIFAFVPMFLTVSVIGLINGFVGKLVDNDNKNKIHTYISSLPLEKNAYIASKYVFIAITSYVFMSLCMIWVIIYNAFAGKNIFSDFLAAFNECIIPLFCLELFWAVIELPMFILMGTKKAKLIKIAITMLFGFVAVAYLLFGNLQWLSDNFDIGVFVEWAENHRFEIILTDVLSPFITLGLYYLSYRFTWHFAGRSVQSYE